MIDGKCCPVWRHSKPVVLSLSMGSNRPTFMHPVYNLHLLYLTLHHEHRTCVHVMQHFKIPKESTLPKAKDTSEDKVTISSDSNTLPKKGDRRGSTDTTASGGGRGSKSPKLVQTSATTGNVIRLPEGAEDLLSGDESGANAAVRTAAPCSHDVLCLMYRVLCLVSCTPVCQ